MRERAGRQWVTHARAPAQPAPARSASTPQPVAAPQATGPVGGNSLASLDRWERTFDADFSGVALHLGVAGIGAAARANRSEIAFASTTPGDSLIAHELAHVVQHQNAAAGIVPMSDDRGELEREAESVAARVAAGQPAGPIRGRADGPLYAPTTPPISSQSYLIINGPMIIASIGNHATLLDLPTGSTYSKWVAGNSKAFAALAYTPSYLDITSGAFETWFAPAAIGPIIDRGRERSTDMTSDSLWREDVATELWNALVIRIRESIARIIPRYERALARAIQQYEAEHGICPANLQPPETDITASHPLDRRTIAALRGGTLDFDVISFRAAHSEFADDRSAVHVELQAPSGGWFWARVTDHPKPSVEQVATALYGSSEFAYALVQATPTLFGFTRSDKLLPEHLEQLGQWAVDPQIPGSATVADAKDRFATGGPRDPDALDPVAELLASPLAEQTAREQAERYAPTGASAAEILKRLHEIDSVIDGAAAAAKLFGYDKAIAAASQEVEARITTIENGDPATAMQWDAHSSKQLALVKAGADGIAAMTKQYTPMIKARDPKADPLNPAFSTPIFELAGLYSDVVAQSFLIDNAAAKLVVAERRLQQFPIEMMEAVLVTLVEQVRRVAEGNTASSANLPMLRGKEQAFRSKLADVRAKVLDDPTALQGLLADLNTEMNTLQMEIAFVANIDALDRAMGQVRDQVGFWNSVFLHEDELAANHIHELEEWVTLWEGVKKYYYSGDPVKQKLAIDRFQQIMDSKEYPALYKRTADYCADAAAWNIVAQVLGVIAITLLSMGIGSLVGGTLEGVLGGGAAAAGVDAAEAAGATIGLVSGSTAATIGFIANQVTQAAIQAVFFAEEKTFGGILKEFVWNLALMGAMHKLSTAYRELKMVKAALDAGRKGWVIAGEAGLQFVAMGIAAETRAAIEAEFKDQTLSRDQMKHILIQHTGMFIAMFIVGRATHPIMQDLETSGLKFGESVAKVNAMRLEVVKLGNETAATAKAVATQQELEAALKPLIELDRKELDLEIKLFEDLGKDEKALEAAGVTQDKLAEVQAAAAEALKDVNVARAMLKANLVAGIQYEVSSRADVDAIIKAHADKGDLAVNKGTDDVLKTETWEITTQNNETYRIVLRLEPVPAGSVVPEVAATKTDAQMAASSGKSGSAAESPKQDAARWAQQIDIGKASARQPAFKDAFARWVDSGMPIEHDGARVRAKLPPDTPHELEPLFNEMLAQPGAKSVALGLEKVELLRARGIDLTHLDPSSPQYLKVRPQLLEVFGAKGLAQYEATMTMKPGAAGRADIDAAIGKTIGERAIAQLTGTFPDCEVIVRIDAAAAAGAPVDVVLIAPDGVSHDVVLGLEKRAGALELPGPDTTPGGPPRELPVHARAMTRGQYLAMRGQPGGATEVRVDARIREPSAKQLGEGFEAARGQVDVAGSLPPEVVDLLTKNLPGIAIDPANPSAGLAEYLKPKYPNAKNLKVEPAGGDAFVIKDGNQTLGVFKIYRSPTEMMREIAAIKRLGDLQLQNLEVPGVRDPAKAASGATGMVVEPAKGELVTDAIKSAGETTGPARVDAVQALKTKVEAVGKALAELHAKTASGAKVTPEQKTADIAALKDRWNRVKAKVPAADRGAIEALLDKASDDYRAADVDAAIVHGEAHAGAFAVQGTGKVTATDVASLFRSVGADGKGVAPAAVDVGGFMESLRTLGAESGLSPAEVLKLQQDFMAAYRGQFEATTGKQVASGMDVATKFYQAEHDLAALERAVAEAADVPKTAPAADRDAAKAKIKTGVGILDATLGRRSRFAAVAAGLDVDPAEAKKFETWLDTARLANKDVENAEYKQRLRDFYDRDPAGAIKLATAEYGFGTVALGPVVLPPPTDEPVADIGTAPPEAARDQAERMLSYLKAAEPGFTGDAEAFAKRYEAGYKFDPVTRRWYVEGGVAKDKPVFPETASAEEVYDVLMGKQPLPTEDPLIDPATVKYESSFKPFVDMLAEAGVEGGNRAKIEARVRAEIAKAGWKGEYVENVRHEVKRAFRDEALGKLVDPDIGWLRDRYPDLDWNGNPDASFVEARFRNLREAVQDLAPSDRGNMLEAWAAKINGLTDPSLIHPVITPESAGQAGLVGVGKNILDAMDGETLTDNKDYEGPLEPNEPQLIQHLKIAGSDTGQPTKIEITDRSAGAAKGATKTITVSKVRWRVTDPRGVLRNAEWMAKWLDASGGRLEFEIYNWKGESRIVPTDIPTSALRSSAIEQFVGDAPSLRRDASGKLK